MMEQNIELKKKRGFSDVLNATFAFIKQEYKLFWRMIILYAGLPVLVYSIFSTIYFRNTFNTLFKVLSNPSQAQEFSQNVSNEVFLIYILSIIMYLFFYGLTYSYVVHYSKNNNRAENTHSVWSMFTGKFMALLGYSLLTLLLIGTAYGIVALFLGALGNPIVAAIGVFATLILVIYISLAFSFILIIKLNEDEPYLESARRCFYLIKGHWWQTFGLVIIAIIIGFALNMALTVPVTSYFTAKGLLSNSKTVDIIPAIIISVSSTLTTVISTPILPLILSFQYFSLCEHKDNTSLLERIKNINSTND
ncbi:hypothetical protein [Plebeiibacterium marinum]|uniref:Glycerophosphoryl diester phosphodiesterase membrane domain-containing protein n=1 Tax=Plebeiibacterium marinum TaxID=2992111 RepID=A0AAE3MHE5_9BACT|nr:hypothetical protein [Plebeiobacterium marinum]MCW3807883.1 hypothetical protein [Plebeiobacterium marinum]